MTYQLYFIKDGKEDFYGMGNTMDYMIELITDYCEVHNMYGNKEITFRIKAKTIEDLREEIYGGDYKLIDERYANDDGTRYNTEDIIRMRGGSNDKN